METARIYSEICESPGDADIGGFLLICRSGCLPCEELIVLKNNVVSCFHEQKPMLMAVRMILAMLLGTSASLLVTSALLVVTMFAIRNKCLTSSNKKLDKAVLYRFRCPQHCCRCV